VNEIPTRTLFEEMVLKIKQLLMAGLSAMLLGLPLNAQDGDSAGAAPQILTSDLTVKQLLDEATKTVSFVFIDDDPIHEISINDEAVSFIPGKTVVVNKRFVFKPGKTLIKVVAVDEAGNRREKSYLVGYAIEEGEQAMTEEQEKEGGLFWQVSFSAALENDDNPSNDLSLPISIGDLEITGVIPDTEQPDQRRVLNGTLVVGVSRFTAFGGASQTTYGKSENEYLNSLAVYFGGGYAQPLSARTKFLLNLIWLDVNVGGEDYSQNMTLSPGLQIVSQDDEGSYKHLIGIDYSTKDFADPDIAAGSQVLLKWVYDSLDADKLDNYHRTFAYGTNDNGTELSKCTYLTFDYDWQNRWESGFKWDLGFGFQHRTYQNEVPLSSETGLGTTRVDLPLRVSTGIGWHFSQSWNLMYDYRYTFNLSNKSPYVRTIHGLTLNGAF